MLPRTMPAPAALRSDGSSAFTAPCVPTAMNAGVERHPASRYPRRASINVCATQNTSPTGSHSSGHGPASTAGLSLANSHTPPRFDELMDAEPGSAEFDEPAILADLVAHDEGKHEPMG